MVLVPTAIITGTPLDCTYCVKDYCGGNTTMDFTNEGKESPGFNNWWVKKFCTYNGSVDPFLLFFPYFLLLIALILFALERIFLKTFQAGNKLEKFYSLLVKEKVLGSPDPEETLREILVRFLITLLLKSEVLSSEESILVGLFMTTGVGISFLPWRAERLEHYIAQ